MKTNPYQVLHRAATAFAVTGVAAFFVCTVMLIVSQNPALLWQIPLAAAAVIFTVMLLGFFCETITQMWRRAEQKWDDKMEKA